MRFSPFFSNGKAQRNIWPLNWLLLSVINDHVQRRADSMWFIFSIHISQSHALHLNRKCDECWYCWKIERKIGQLNSVSFQTLLNLSKVVIDAEQLLAKKKNIYFMVLEGILNEPFKYRTVQTTPFTTTGLSFTYLLRLLFSSHILNDVPIPNYAIILLRDCCSMWIKKILINTGSSCIFFKLHLPALKMITRGNAQNWSLLLFDFSVYSVNMFECVACFSKR